MSARKIFRKGRPLILRAAGEHPSRFTGWGRRAARRGLPALAAALGVLALAAGLPSSSSGQVIARPDPVVLSLSRAVDNHVVPTFAALASETSLLSRTVVRVCAYPSEVSRAAFVRAMERSVRVYGAASVVRIGPSVEDVEMERLATPVGATRVTAVALEGILSGAVPAPRDRAELHGFRPALQGLPALEMVLYQVVSGGGDLDDGRCRLARMIAAHVAALAADLHADWVHPTRFRPLARQGGEDETGAVPTARIRRDVVELVYAGVGRLETELTAAVGTGGDLGPAPSVRTFGTPVLQVAYMDGQAHGLVTVLHPQAFAPVLGTDAGPAVETVRTSLRRVRGAVVAVRPAGTFGDDEIVLLAQALSEVAELRVAIAGELSSAAGISMSPFQELLR